MRSQPAHTGDSEYLAASRLAEMGYCEQKIVLERKLGRRETAQQHKAKEAGRQEHAQFDRLVTTEHNRRSDSLGDRRCFIATAVYGPDDPRTQQLRAWRDRVMIPSSFGRFLVRVYYLLSPGVASILDKHAALRKPVATLLDAFRLGLPDDGEREGEGNEDGQRDQANRYG